MNVHRLQLTPWLAALLPAWLAACDALPSATVAALDTPPMLAASTITDAAPARTLPPLHIDLAASPFGPTPEPDPQAVPWDEHARTRPGLYLTSEQAEAFYAQLQGDAAWVRADCCGPDLIKVAVGTVQGLVAAKNLDRHAPVFVDGENLPQAARVVDRLDEDGYTRVYLVTTR